LRVYVGGVSRWAGQIPVYTAWAGGGIRHARILWPVPHVDADHDRAIAEGRTPSGARGNKAGLVRPDLAGLRTCLRKGAGRPQQAAGGAAPPPGDRAGWGVFPPAPP